MIERKFVNQNIKEYMIQEYIDSNIKRVGHSHTKLKKTPLGDKIVIHASMPGLVVGRSGANIKKLTKSLKTEFGLENPQIEMNDVENINLNPRIIAERIANSLERFGTNRFKGIMHKSLADVMNAGARGVEILISGKVPGARAKRWRVYQGYLKKCGNVAVEGVAKATNSALVKTGAIGIQVKIMPPDVRLPDDIIYLNLESEKKPIQESESVTKKEAKSVKQSDANTKKISKSEKKLKKESKPESKKEPKSQQQPKSESKSDAKDEIELELKSDKGTKLEKQSDKTNKSDSMDKLAPKLKSEKETKLEYEPGNE